MYVETAWLAQHNRVDGRQHVQQTAAGNPLQLLLVLMLLRRLLSRAVCLQLELESLAAAAALLLCNCSCCSCTSASPASAAQRCQGAACAASTS
jgi:hypothetical protein